MKQSISKKQAKFSIIMYSICHYASIFVGMKREKQLKLIQVLDSGRYHVIGNDVYDVKGNRLKGGTLPSGYRQYKLGNGKRGKDNVSVIVYHHVLSYIATCGMYDDRLVIDHIDNDVSNNCASNLVAIEQRHNVNPKATAATKTVKGYKYKVIRSEAISSIRKLMKQGYSQSYIAKALNLNRTSVRYLYNKIANNEPLKYE